MVAADRHWCVFPHVCFACGIRLASLDAGDTPESPRNNNNRAVASHRSCVLRLVCIPPCMCTALCMHRLVCGLQLASLDVSDIPARWLQNRLVCAPACMCIASNQHSLLRGLQLPSPDTGDTPAPPFDNKSPQVATDRLLYAPPCVCNALYVQRLVYAPPCMLTEHLANATATPPCASLVCLPPPPPRVPRSLTKATCSPTPPRLIGAPCTSLAPDPPTPCASLAPNFHPPSRAACPNGQPYIKKPTCDAKVRGANCGLQHVA